MLRDQLGKRLADEAERRFRQRDAGAGAARARSRRRPLRDRETGRGTNTVEIAQQRFRFTDRAEKTAEEVRAERPRQDRPGRSDTYKPRAPRKDEADEGAPGAKCISTTGAKARASSRRPTAPSRSGPNRATERPAGARGVLQGRPEEALPQVRRPLSWRCKAPLRRSFRGCAPESARSAIVPARRAPSGDRPAFATDRKSAPRRDHAGAAERPSRPNYGDKPRGLRPDGDRPTHRSPAARRRCPRTELSSGRQDRWICRQAKNAPTRGRPAAGRLAQGHAPMPARHAPATARRESPSSSAKAPRQAVVRAPLAAPSRTGPRSFAGPKTDGPPRGPRPGSGPKKPRPPRS